MGGPRGGESEAECSPKPEAARCEGSEAGRGDRVRSAISVATDATRVRDEGLHGSKPRSGNVLLQIYAHQPKRSAPAQTRAAASHSP